MMRLNWRKTVIWTIIAILACAAAIALAVRVHRWRQGAERIKGAVILRDDDSRKELPIADVTVTASDGVTTAMTQSNESGYFNLPFQTGVWPGQNVTLSFRHPGYEPLDITVQSGFRRPAKQLYIARMAPKNEKTAISSGKPPIVVSNIRVRYTVNSRTDVNIGSAVKTFQVINKGNLPCDRRAPCSPDGNWKASIGYASLDAGASNEFRDVRVSCIAGPCPFTRVDPGGFVSGGRNISVSVLDWSDATTFLLEAEVFHTEITSNVRESYPVVFGEALNFTLPANEEGVSLEAELNGANMVFPLGPSLYLSWATCTARTDRKDDKTFAYRCELKPGFRF